MSEITHRQLEYFVAVADAGTVTGAARNLHLSQSALSMALSDLEGALGVQLLVRGRRGVHLTQAGRGVLSDSRRLIAGVADLHNSARDFQESMSGRLVVGCYSTLSPLLLPAVIDAFTTDHPDVACRSSRALTQYWRNSCEAASWTSHCCTTTDALTLRASANSRPNRL